MPAGKKYAFYLALFFSIPYFLLANPKPNKLETEGPHFVLVLGDSSSVKSTIINDLLGNEHTTEDDEISEVKDASRAYAPMGFSSLSSFTKQAKLFSLKHRGREIGFWDTVSLNKKASTSPFNKILSLVRGVSHSCILMIPLSEITSLRGANFPISITNLLKIFTEEEIFALISDEASDFYITIKTTGRPLGRSKAQKERMLTAFSLFYTKELNKLERENKVELETLQKEGLELPEKYDEYKQLLNDSDNVSREAKYALKQLWKEKEVRVFLKVLEKDPFHYWDALDKNQDFKEAFFRSAATKKE